MIHPSKDNFETQRIVCTKSIGTFNEGKQYSAVVQAWCGRQYQPGKGEDGKWVDIIGEKEKHVTVYDHSNLKTFESIEDAREYFTNAL